MQITEGEIMVEPQAQNFGGLSLLCPKNSAPVGASAPSRPCLRVSMIVIKGSCCG